MILAMALFGATIEARPLRLEVTTENARSVVRVVAESAEPCSATYQLEVTNGGNRSVSRGTTTIVPGRPQTLASVGVGSHGGPDVTAKLVAQPCGRAPYVLDWVSPARPR